MPVAPIPAREGLHSAPDPDGVVDVGYGMVPSRGEGPLSESLRGLSDCVLSQPCVSRGSTELDHVPSQRVLVPVLNKYRAQHSPREHEISPFRLPHVHL